MLAEDEAAALKCLNPWLIYHRGWVQSSCRMGTCSAEADGDKELGGLGGNAQEDTSSSSSSFPELSH